jgi:F-type H+-transporting ATPase subunit delta
MMQGSSGESLARLNVELGKAIDSGADGAAVGDSLFGAADVLLAEPALRRAATDPSSPADAKAALAKGVFGGKLDSVATDLVASAVQLRWARSGDLAAGLEELAVSAVVKAADAKGEADRLEDELFQVGQAVTQNPELRDALSDPGRTVADKQGLVRSLLEGKASAGVVRLAERSVTGSSSVTRTLNEYARVAAESRNRVVALVRTARALSEDEHKRLGEALSRQYDRPVHLNVMVDPKVLGGVRVEIGDQVIDGTVASRLDDARRHLAG